MQTVLFVVMVALVVVLAVRSARRYDPRRVPVDRWKPRRFRSEPFVPPRDLGAHGPGTGPGSGGAEAPSSGGGGSS